MTKKIQSTVVPWKTVKYGNTRCVVNGVSFDSKMEAKRYGELLTLEIAGKIRALELQPRFVLNDKFETRGVKYRAINYVADFRYFCDEGDIVEDVKGFETKEYLLKRKLFLSMRESGSGYICKDLIFRELRAARGAWLTTEL